ncbi:protoglobin domain-containing protein [Elioraea sp.]|uniref:protoglobin domain-containing protein n=1 Tax=Elioraea sp. TaxID=2185103 RepID=UPI003F6F3E8F
MNAPATDIPGYRYGDPLLAPSPLTPAALAELEASLLFGPDDVAALKRAGTIVADRIEAILDVWYGFVASQPHLLAAFREHGTGEPIGAYLTAVRRRFGQWILDTCNASHDAAWLAWQEEIGRRHHRSGKNRTDGVNASPYVPLRHLLALVMPISLTMRPFLAEKGAAPAEVDAMHAAWTKAVLLQAILWARPYVTEGEF